MKKKIISMALVVAMVAVMLTSFTMAYFTDTDEADNVFTVGDIDIELHEKNEAGDEDDAYQDWLEEQTIMPGEQLDKIVWVENTGNQPAYVRVTITVPEGMEAVWGTNLDGWTRTPAEGTGAGKYVYTSNTPLAAGAKTPDLLTDMMLSDTVTELNALAEYNVNVYVEAIQSAGFDSAAEAYDALTKAENVATKSTAASASEANTALAAGDAVVQLSDDINSTAAIVMGKNTALDGNGNTITKDASQTTGTNAGVDTTGGTIKNVTIEGDTNADDKGFRAVYVVSSLKSDLIIDNAVLNGTYAININGVSPDYSLSVSNSKLNGWVSYGEIAGATFTECDFNGGAYNTYRPYADSVLTNCTFTAGYNFSAGAEGLTIELNNCTVGGTTVTAATFTTLFNVAADDALRACNVIVDGVSVVF